MPNASYTRIPLVANQIVTGTLFGTAIIVIAIRTYIRARVVQQFALEDGLLLLAVAILATVTSLYYRNLISIYQAMELVVEGPTSSLVAEVYGQISSRTRVSEAMAMLWWLVIFPVKLAYLVFFYKLTARVKKLRIWWWCVVVFVIPAGVVCIAASALDCPQTKTLDIIAHCSGPLSEKHEVRIVAVTTALDIATDILIVSFPLLLLWNVKISMRQKCGLSVMLSLSLVMVVFAIIRMAGIRLPGVVIDIVWLGFWQQQECSIAVIMFSMTAFRSFFVAGSLTPAKACKPPTTYWRIKNLLRRSPRHSDEESLDALPIIPSATLTGMMTMINDNGRLDSKGSSSIDRETLLS